MLTANKETNVHLNMIIVSSIKISYSQSGSRVMLTAIMKHNVYIRVFMVSLIKATAEMQHIANR